MNLAITKNLPQIPPIQATKTSSNSNKATLKLSKTLFPATSGSFSASNTAATTKSSKAAKQESPQPDSNVNKYKKKRKLVEATPEIMPEPAVVTTKKSKKKEQLELKKKQQQKQNNKNAQTPTNKKSKLDIKRHSV